MIKFTESNKWKDPWFRKLTPGEKLVFLYLCDNCDNAGFYEIDLELMAFTIGTDVNKVEGALKGLTRGLFSSGQWVWLKNYLKHQRNIPLNVDNNSHRQIMGIIADKLHLFPQIPEYLGANLNDLGAYKGVATPISKGKGKGKGKGRSKVNIDKQVNLNNIQVYFYERFKEHTGKPYAVNYGKDGAIFKELKKTYEEKDLINLIDRFFSTDNEFINKTGRTVGVFKSTINQFLSASRILTDKEKEEIRNGYFSRVAKRIEAGNNEDGGRSVESPESKEDASGQGSTSS